MSLLQNICNYNNVSNKINFKIYSYNSIAIFSLIIAKYYPQYITNFPELEKLIQLVPGSVSFTDMQYLENLKVLIPSRSFDQHHVSRLPTSIMYLDCYNVISDRINDLRRLNNLKIYREPSPTNIDIDKSSELAVGSSILGSDSWALPNSIQYLCYSGTSPIHCISCIDNLKIIEIMCTKNIIFIDKIVQKIKHKKNQGGFPSLRLIITENGIHKFK